MRMPVARPVPDVRNANAGMEKVLDLVDADPKLRKLLGARKLVRDGAARRPCRSCNGSGASKFSRDACYWCGGRGYFDAPDYQAIWDAIMTRRGAPAGKVTLRRSAPSRYDERKGGSLAARAYYVWRMARFHSGVDVTMPVEAQTVCEYDPYREELEVFANLVALLVYGTCMGAAARWGAALGWISYEQAAELTGGLVTALYGGPVAVDKPEEELYELR